MGRAVVLHSMFYYSDCQIRFALSGADWRLGSTSPPKMRGRR